MKKYLTWGVLAATLVAVMVLVGGNQSASKVSADGSMDKEDGIWISGDVVRELFDRFLGQQPDSLGSQEPGSMVVGNSGSRFPNGLSTGTTSPAAGQVLTSTLKVGMNGTNNAEITDGFCNIYAPAATVPVNATQVLTCHQGSSNNLVPLNGVASGDSCQLQQATTTLSLGMGLNLNGANASSSNGYIHAIVSHASSTAFTWSAAASSTWTYHCFDPA